MTTIVAAETKKGVIFACDSQVSKGHRKESLPKKNGKIVSNGDITFGFAGTFRVLNVLKHATLPKVPKSNKRKDIERWAVTKLIPAMQKALEDAKAAEFKDGEANSYSSLIVAVNKRLFEVGSDFSYCTSDNRVYSIGSGSAYALGALGAGADPGQAVAVAAFFDSYTGGEIHEVTL